jgi:hypothetical protein
VPLAAGGTFTAQLTTALGGLGDGVCYPGATCFIDIQSYAAGSSLALSDLSKPITFAQPAITVSPSAGLVNGSAVTVSGSGFAFVGSLALEECNPNYPTAGAAACSVLGNANATDAGTFLDSVTVSTGAVGDGTCGTGAADATCYLRAIPFPPVLGVSGAVQKISFKTKAVPPPPPPSVAVSPSKGILPGQAVTVSGTGFPGASVAISECATDFSTSGYPTACATTPATASLSPNGSFLAQISVSTGALGDGTCPAGGTCFFDVRSFAAGGGGALAHLSASFGVATPKVSLSPTKGLVGGTPVTVSGTGLGLGQTEVYECNPHIQTEAPAQACATGYGVTPTAAGSLVTQIPMVAGSVGDGSCGTEPGDATCYLAVAAAGDPIQLSKITFTAPSAAVAPSTGLLPGQAVTVSGAGLAGVTVDVAQCAADLPSSTEAAACSSTPAWGVLGAGGTFSVATTVVTGTVGNGTCAPGGTCYLDVRSFAPGGTAPLDDRVLPITFAQPTLSAAPIGALLDGQQVVATGSGFDPSAGLTVFECNPNVTTEAPSQACSSGQTVSPSSTGAFVTGITVSTGPVGDGTCGTGTTDSTCYLAAVPAGGAPLLAKLTFAVPTAKVTPSTKLTGGQSVTVSGAGLSGTTVAVTQCNADVITEAPSQACAAAPAVTAALTPTGAFVASASVQTGTVGDGTCGTGTTDTTCYLEVQSSAGGSQLDTLLLAITFPPVKGAPPVVHVAPSTALSDGQDVNVSGSGFAANEYVTVEECTAGFLSDPNGCDTTLGNGPGQKRLMAVSAGGALGTFSYPVATGAIGDGTCGTTSADATCKIVVTGINSSNQQPIPNQQAWATIQFTVAGGPTASANPSAGLTNGSTTSVSGGGFDSSESIEIEKCNDNVTSGDPYACIVAPGSFPGAAVLTTSDASGNLAATPFTLRTGQVGDGTCGTGAGDSTCYLAVTGVDNTETPIPGQAALVPISFS